MSFEIEQTPNHYIITFGYRPDRLRKLKASFPPGVLKWNAQTKSWTVALNQSAIVERFAANVDAKWKLQGESEVVFNSTDFGKAVMPELDVELNLKRELFPYQKQGVAYILDKKKLIVGDQPGLGKTAQAIAAIETAGAYPCLIICPSSLKINWQREIKMWTGKDAMILESNVKHNFHFYAEAGMYQHFIVNFESLKKYFVEKITTPKGHSLRLDHIVFRNKDLFKSVVIDEAHRVKSISTQQTKFSKGICNGKEWIIAMTGTPVINKPVDLVSQLGIIGRMPELVSYKNFVNRFCQGQRQASHLGELNKMLTDNCFYRREKTEVMQDLPAKTRQVVICDINTRTEYNHAMSNLESYLREYKKQSDKQIQKSMRGEIMVRIGILKNISARGKMPSLFEFINDTLESGEKLIVFAHLKDVIAQIKKEYPEAVSITGDDGRDERQASVDKFQSDPKCKLIICSMKAAGVGLTLTASSRVCFVELPWTFADCEQCEDRAHRIGQHDNVTCTYLLGEKTIDQKIYQIIIEKKSIAQAVTGASDDVEESTVSQLIDLFNQPEMEAA